MNSSRARALAFHDRQCIGRVLGIARKCKATGQVPPIRISDQLSKASTDLHRLYREHPEIKPERVKQFSIFDKENNHVQACRD